MERKKVDIPIEEVRRSEYKKIVIGSHLGFLLFLILYAFVEDTAEWLMGNPGAMRFPYNMSGLIFDALGLFMASFAGAFEGLCFSLYVNRKWKASVINGLELSGTFFLAYFIALELFRSIGVQYGNVLWEPVTGSTVRAIYITGKEVIWLALGCLLGRTGYEIRKKQKY